MSTQNRLVALLCVVLATFAVSSWLLHRSHQQESGIMMDEIRAERGELLDHVLRFQGQALENFAFDYSYWDELAQFVATPRQEWAQINLATSLESFDLNAIWVLRPDGTRIYEALHETPSGAKILPPDLDAIVATFRQKKFVHFHIADAGEVYELRVAPIQPSVDAERKTEPLGWLIAARHWSESYRKQVGTILRSEMELILAKSANRPAPTPEPDEVVLERTFAGWNGEPVATLRATHHAAPLHLLHSENKTEQLLFSAFGAMAALCVFLGVGQWVILPLRQLEYSLSADSAAPLRKLQKKNDEFGRLARLVSASFEHRSALETEVHERRGMENALRQSQQELHDTTELKNRLARDLHDSVIQSLYAAGLGLEGVRGSLRTDPDGAERRIAAAQESLNHTIRDVRAFITGLEPERHDRVPFEQALRTLVSTLQGLHSARIQMILPRGRPPTLSPAEEVHALQIVRESVSNAMRHGQPTEVTVKLQVQDGTRTLTIEDNGRGFDPAEVARQSGLTNLAIRAQEIGGAISIESSGGKGTRVILTFSQTAPA